MYIVKIGNYYVRHVNISRTVDNKYYIKGDIELSRELMRGYSKEVAEAIADKIGGKVEKIREEVTND